MRVNPKVIVLGGWTIWLTQCEKAGPRSKSSSCCISWIHIAVAAAPVVHFVFHFLLYFMNALISLLVRISWNTHLCNLFSVASRCESIVNCNLFSFFKKTVDRRWNLDLVYKIPFWFSVSGIYLWGLRFSSSRYGTPWLKVVISYWYLRSGKNQIVNINKTLGF